MSNFSLDQTLIAVSSSSTDLKGRRLLKSHNFCSQEKKRSLFLERQKKVRLENVESFRNTRILHQAERENDITNDDVMQFQDISDDYENESSERTIKRKVLKYQMRDYYSYQLSTAEWMTEIPQDLKTEWYVLCRPQGTRVILFANTSSTECRSMDGRLLHTFYNSRIPPRTRLDCIFSEENNTFYALDVMIWNGCSLYDCTTEFRFYWLQSRCQEFHLLRPIKSTESEINLELVPFFNSDETGLSICYNVPDSLPVSYTPDGLLFYHKQGHYQRGLTPLVLFWKDSNSSPYFIDSHRITDENDHHIEAALILKYFSESGGMDGVDHTSMDEVLTEEQAEFPNYNSDNKFEPIKASNDIKSTKEATGHFYLTTMDNYTITMIDDKIVKKHQFQQGDIIRCNCKISHSILSTGKEDLILNSLQAEIIRKCSDRKALPDPWSKIFFYLNASRNPIHMQHLLSCL